MWVAVTWLARVVIRLLVRRWHDTLAAHLSSLQPFLAVGVDVAIPYAAVIAGVVGLEELGVRGQDVSRTLSTGMVASLGMLAVIGVGGWWCQRAMDFRPGEREDMALLRAIGQQAHWAFYRAGALAVFYPSIGIFVGSGLVIAEWLADPAWRAQWAHHTTAWRPTRDLAILLVSSLLFLLTGILWWGVLVHIVTLLAPQAMRKSSP
jgi:hypothetical protein